MTLRRMIRVALVLSMLSAVVANFRAIYPGWHGNRRPTLTCAFCWYRNFCSMPL
jgi:hypothetical protein